MLTPLLRDTSGNSNFKSAYEIHVLYILSPFVSSYLVLTLIPRYKMTLYCLFLSFLLKLWAGYGCSSHYHHIHNGYGCSSQYLQIHNVYGCSSHYLQIYNRWFSLWIYKISLMDVNLFKKNQKNISVRVSAGIGINTPPKQKFIIKRNIFGTSEKFHSFVHGYKPAVTGY